MTHKVKRSKESAHSFDDFWKNYPKHNSKGAARKAWGRLKPTGELLDTIITAAKDDARRAEAGEFAGPKGRLQYCKHPATWLNVEGWTDESDEPEFASRELTEAEADELLKEVL